VRVVAGRDTTPAADGAVSQAALRAALERVRQDGYAVNRNQYLPGVCAIAAPVLDEKQAPLAAIAISMPDSRFDPRREAEWGRLVAETAAEISARRLR
jgi:IclR family acetate operon transcriptional repressor